MTQSSKNPLKVSILDILRAADRALSEYELIVELQQSGLADAHFGSETERLYRLHFLVMNALYQLQNELAEAGFALRISPLAIELTRMSVEQAGLVAAAGDAALRDYYLDWGNSDLQRDELDHLLAQFWLRLASPDRLAKAFASLGLAPGSRREEIKLAYRRLARDAHPDRGGSTAHFLEVREAYELLMRSV